ncbi:hypothetical protein BDQ12DRAFT_146394 [Crucibulum laeve]|uniref:DUF6533 domain-containing protein n=1 Tax=Crucibulum laeve TaxID=68775 RepID=A0A5C3M0C1_9AGAR|nr:hypothetical protein BDQ12DRAFT_146394 [Crucibulum laeve]
MEGIEILAEQGTAVNLVAAACLTCLLYDHVLTLDQEIKRIGRDTLIQLHIGGTVSNSRRICVFYLRWLALSGMISTCIVQGILMLRVWAIHKQNKVALAFGSFFYFGGSITLIGLVIQDYVGEGVVINRALGSLPGCYPTTVPAIIAGTWIAPLIVESVLFFLVISRAFTWWRNGSSAPRILSLLTRDSTLYFAIAFAFLLASYLVFQLGPPFLSSLLVTYVNQLHDIQPVSCILSYSPSAVAGCILGSHMLLNLRELSDPDDEQFESNRSNVVFALPSRRIWPMPGSDDHATARSEARYFS